MAGIIEVGSKSGLTLYATLHNSTGQVWNGSSFVSYNSANWSTYAISLTEQTGSGYYTAAFPSVTAGKYTVKAYKQFAGSPAIDDGAIGPMSIGSIQWTGSKIEQGIGLVLADYKLDLVALSSGNPTVGSLLDHIMNKNGGQTFDQTTDSLEAIRDGGSGGPTAAQIADAVWDEVLDGTHTTSDSAAERLKAIDDKLPTSGLISNFNKATDTVLLAANQSSVTIGTVNALGTQAKADVLQQVQDALGVDALTELTAGTPPANPTLKQAIMFAYMALRNKRIATSEEEKIYNNADTAIARATLSDDGVTTTKEKFTAP